MSRAQILLAIVGLAAITVITRGFFMIAARETPLPDWLREALRYAPLAALVAVIVPDIAMTDGHLVSTWKDARLFGALVGALTFWRWRHLLATILAGAAAFLALRLVLGW
ncbi:MAG: AzlD domain-containing protein [Burkholderiaceae bacterium]